MNEALLSRLCQGHFDHDLRDLAPSPSRDMPHTPLSLPLGSGESIGDVPWTYECTERHVTVRVAVDSWSQCQPDDGKRCLDAEERDDNQRQLTSRRRRNHKLPAFSEFHETNERRKTASFQRQRRDISEPVEKSVRDATVDGYSRLFGVVL
jgi:hypothetical protein